MTSSKLREASTIARAAVVLTLSLLMPFSAYGANTVTVVNPVSNPVKTSITNAVVPVEVSNADPIPVSLTESVTAASDAAMGAIADRTEDLVTVQNRSFTRDAVISSAVVYAGLASSAAGHCIIIANLIATPVVELGTFFVLPGQSAVFSIPVPNVLLPANSPFRMELLNITGGGTCTATVMVQGKFL